MTQPEINERSNQCKSELNQCKIRVENCGHAIEAFEMLKNYYAQKTNEVKTKKLLSIFSTVISAMFATCFLFISIPVFIVSMGVLGFSINRTCFFVDVEKKFNHCHTYFGNIVTHLQDKKLTYSEKCKLILEEIIKLENELPDKKCTEKVCQPEIFKSTLVDDVDVVGL